MGKITYQWFVGSGSKYINVYLDGTLMGYIDTNAEQTVWQYFPRGTKKGGEKFFTLSQCKQSLEGE